jgi:hypothetical protein
MLRRGRLAAPAGSPTLPAMDAFLVSTAIVALAEIGDKTQLLAFILAAKFRRPWPIVPASWSPPWPTTPSPPRSAPG